MKFVYNDGGRSNYYKTKYKKDRTNDCVIRAIAIALNIDYILVRDALFDYAKYIGRMPNDKFVYEAFLDVNGWVKKSPLKKSNGKKYKVKNISKFFTENVIIHTTNHLTTLKNGNLNDLWDCREWCANSYYVKEQ